MTSILRRGPSPTDIFSAPGSLSPSIVVSDPAIERNRERMRRQLFSFFLYPFVYIIIWCFPFISHVLGYDDALTAGDPQWLVMLSIISLCVQGTVDCLLFSIREEPWKHTKAGFWKSLAKRLTWNWNGSWRGMGMPGRTREQMLVDGRIARARRKQEIKHEANGKENLYLAGQRVDARNWWDAELTGAVGGPSETRRSAEEIWATV